MRVVSVAFVMAIWFAPAAYGHEGWGIVVDERFGVLVADVPANCVWRIAEGRAVAAVRNVHSHDLHIGADGAVYGTNPEPRGNLSSVWRLDRSRRFSYVLPPSAGSPLGLQSFLLARDGSIYSASRYDHRRPAVVLLRRGPTGDVVPIAGGAKGTVDGSGDAARFAGIDGMSEASDGTLVIADGVHLRTVSRTGHVATVTRPLTVRRWGEDLLGISSTRGDVVYIADHAQRRVLRVNWKNGHTEEAARSGLFWAPAGVEQWKDDLYVLEHLRPPLSILGDLKVGPYLRVRRVASDGASMTLATIWGRHSAAAAVASAALLLAVFSVVLWRKRRLTLRATWSKV